MIEDTKENSKIKIPLPTKARNINECELTLWLIQTMFGFGKCKRHTNKVQNCLSSIEYEKFTPHNIFLLGRFFSSFWFCWRCCDRSVCMACVWFMIAFWFMVAMSFEVECLTENSTLRSIKTQAHTFAHILFSWPVFFSERHDMN